MESEGDNLNRYAKQSYILIFTDGASAMNPGPSGYGAIIVFPNHHVLEVGGNGGFSTNNRMEITAAIVALEKTRDHSQPIHFYTDSTYLIRGITQWMPRWIRRAWKTTDNKDIVNQDLWIKLEGLVKQKENISWNYVKGHAGTPGNERADEIAVAFSRKHPIQLYEGPLSGYSIPVLRLPPKTQLKNQKYDPKNKVKKEIQIFYMSLVENLLQRHPTWEECEKRVKGRSGAKFKKISNPEEEELTLEKWGLKKII